VKNFLILFFVFSIFIPVTRAELSDKFRDNFTNIVRDLCHNSNPEMYDLERSVEEVSTEYHSLQNNIFKAAFSTSMKRTNKQKNSSFAKDLPELRNWLKNAEFSSEVNVKSVQAMQSQEGFETQCEDKLLDAEGMFLDEVISCKVTETVLNEFCAYEKFLWAKTRDDRTLIQLARERNEENKLLPEESSVLDETIKNEFKSELGKARQALSDTLYLYQRFEQSYRIHSQLVVLQNQLIKVRDRLGQKYLPAFSLFPNKFIDAASKVPRQ
jgi:hypothetical protein